MRLLNRCTAIACVFAFGLVLHSLTPPAGPPTIRTVTPPMDVLYAMPGDLNYSYGPKGDELSRLSTDRPATATFTVTYNGFSPEAQAAFQAALNIWAATLTSPAPIRVVANWTDLGSSSGILGSAGPSGGCTIPTDTSHFYAAALADKLNGSAFCAAIAAPAGANDREINANFNSAFADWDFGTTGVPVAGKYNFMTVVLHEVGHGLGFFGRFTSAGGVGNLSSSKPYIFDQFTTVGPGGGLLLNIARPSTTLHAQLTSDNTYWNGTNALNAKVETSNFSIKFPGRGDDNGFLAGSSYSHVDYTTYAGTSNGLMAWALNSNVAYTAIGPIMAGMFKDEGWTVTSTAHAPGDYTGDGVADLAVFRPGNGQFFVRNGASAAIGAPGDIPVVGDFNGDGTADIAVYRPSTGLWIINGQSPIAYGVPGDVPVPGDFNGDGVTDAAVFRTYTGPVASWFIRNVGQFSFGLRGDIPVVADYDGDGKDDIAVYRPSTGTWYIQNSGGGTTTTQFGLPGDIPVPGKYDSDAHADLAVYRPSTGTWYLKLSAGGTPSYSFGLTGDVPIARDLSGDGVAELIVYRPAEGNWYAFNRIAVSTSVTQYGLIGDIPVHQRPRLPAAPQTDFDGDGISDITVYRPSQGLWFTKLSSTGFSTSTQTQWGLNGDLRVPGDYDGDRKSDYAIYRPSTGDWIIRRSSNGTTLQLSWGLSGDVPVPGDYDGDGLTDIAVFRPSTQTWYVKPSSTGFTTFTQTQWGISGDTPVVGDFDGDGRVDPAVYRASAGTWYIKTTTTAFGTSFIRSWGLSGDTPMPGDFDGDGRTDLTVYRPSTARWYGLDAILGTPTGPNDLQWGAPTDTPVTHDFDGDGVTDAAVFRPASGEWYILKSTNGTLLYVSWGLPTDGPLIRKGGG